MLAKNLSRFISSVLLSLLCTVSFASLGDGETDFSLALYQQLDQDQQNTVVSPFSLRDALAMAYLGADKTTQASMNKALSYNLSPSDLVAAINQRNQALVEAVGDSNTFTSANSLWIDQSASFLKSYEKAIQPLSSSSIYQIDFNNAPDQAVKKINDWASKNTDGMITDLMTPNDIKPQTALVLVNALYFKGVWETPFEELATRKAPFHEDKDHQSSVFMMYKTHYFPYYESDDYQMLDLPYKDSSVSMIVILPKDRDQDLTALLDNIGDVQKPISSLQNTKVKVSLPKFKIASTWSGLLATMTQMMGVSKIEVTQTVSGAPLVVDAIIQQAVIEVDESGAKAAAATAAFEGYTSNRYGKSVHSILFKADHPFIYMIYDHRTQNILFMGQMVSGHSST